MAAKRAKQVGSPEVLVRLARDAGVVVTAAVCFLGAALWNRYPLMFYDTSAYIFQAFRSYFFAERSVFYSWFMRATGAGISLWWVALAQVLLTSICLLAYARVLVPESSRRAFLVTAVLVSICTGLPWSAPMMLPDFLTPLLVVAIYMLAFARLSTAASVALAALVVLAMTAHASNIGLGIGLTLFLVASRPLAVRRNWPVPRWRAAALACAIALALIVSANYARKGEVFLNRSGPAFFLARLIEDGVVKRLLDDTCPGSNYFLCPYKDHLPVTADKYLWENEIFPRVDGFEKTGAESASMIADSLWRYPWMHLGTAIQATVKQFFMVKSGDLIEPQNDLILFVLRRVWPEEIGPYLGGRQQQGPIDFTIVNALYVPVSYLALAALALIAIGRWPALGLRNWAVFMLVALLGNAFICGVFSGPHNRYQSRLLWLAVFTLILPLAQRLLPGQNRVEAQA